MLLGGVGARFRSNLSSPAGAHRSGDTCHQALALKTGTMCANCEEVEPSNYHLESLKCYLDPICTIS